MKSRISSKGQVTVPVEVRRALGLVAGVAVEFLVREGEAVMRKRSDGTHPVDAIYGTLRLPKSVDALIDDMRGPRPAKTTKRPKRPKRGR
jgi:AbrB family looped-hinge helix DNA binding protein